MINKNQKIQNSMLQRIVIPIEDSVYANIKNELRMSIYYLFGFVSNIPVTRNILNNKIRKNRE